MEWSGDFKFTVPIDIECFKGPYLSIMEGDSAAYYASRGFSKLNDHFKPFTVNRQYLPQTDDDVAFAAHLPCPECCAAALAELLKEDVQLVVEQAEVTTEIATGLLVLHKGDAVDAILGATPYVSGTYIEEVLALCNPECDLRNFQHINVLVKSATSCPPRYD